MPYDKKMVEKKSKKVGGGKVPAGGGKGSAHNTPVLSKDSK